MGIYATGSGREGKLLSNFSWKQISMCASVWLSTQFSMEAHIIISIWDWQNYLKSKFSKYKLKTTLPGRPCDRWECSPLYYNDLMINICNFSYFLILYTTCKIWANTNNRILIWQPTWVNDSIQFQYVALMCYSLVAQNIIMELEQQFRWISVDYLQAFEHFVLFAFCLVITIYSCFFF